MKKTLLTAILILVGTIVIVESCSNDDSSTPAANVLCNGTSKTSFFPLDSGNTWSYDYSISSQSPDLSIIGHRTFGSYNYSVLDDASNVMYSSRQYLREDPVNHNIYKYNDISSIEYLLIPASPQLNQKVTNLSASVKTAHCSYTGLLEISEYDGAEVVNKYYYKKGLGMVCEKGYAIFTSTYELYSVKLH
jgi:hypothetical protein